MRRRDFIALTGGWAAGWPVGARGQTSATPVVGFLHPASKGGTYSAATASFLKALAENGYVEGKSIRIEYRFADNNYGRLPELAADLVRQRVSVIAAMTTPTVRIAMTATTTIPIVFTTIADPVQSGFVTSLSHPGGNVTGVGLLSVEVGPKLLELLHEAAPSAKLTALLLNPTNPNVEDQTRSLQEAAVKLGLQPYVVKARTEEDFAAVFADLQQSGVGALMISQDPFYNTQTAQLASLALKHKIPAIYQLRDFALAGGLMTYGASQTEAWHQAGVYVGRILNGERPANLPVMQATKLDFLINLKTAKALGLDIPLAFVNRADEVIE